MQIEKLIGFTRIYQAEIFPDEVARMFGKGAGERKRYLRWLYVWLSVLDRDGRSAIKLEQFELLKGTEDPEIFTIRHPHSQINERYLYVYFEEEAVILLTAFKEKNSKDYLSAIKKAQNIYNQLSED